MDKLDNKMRNKDMILNIKVKGHASVVLIVVLILLVIATGWVKNIIKLSECDFESPYKAEFIHTAGLVPPVGAITGWINVGK